MKIVLMVILMDILIFSFASLYEASPFVNHYKTESNHPDHFGYEWKLETNH
jgi:hypothetical protein